MTEAKQGFITPLRVENIDAKNWRIISKLQWIGWKGDLFEVEEGDLTDFASVPWWSQSILPRTGTWTKAAVLHDKMCELLNAYYKAKLEYDALIAGWRSLNQLTRLNNPEPAPPIPPLFSAVDTDAIFRKNAREDGTDPIRSELLWFGVRSGALKNPARREDWMSTFPRWFVDLIAILLFLTLVIGGLVWLL